jgi:hypothetical protein
MMAEQTSTTLVTLEEQVRILKGNIPVLPSNHRAAEEFIP